jgi:UDP-N-acetyl-D-mannosaminuronate dehydrogenase
MSAPVIGFAGLTHLGLVSALAVASKGFRVVGYDTDAARVGDIAAGRRAGARRARAQLRPAHILFQPG